jgi:RHS repeat-associated protein
MYTNPNAAESTLQAVLTSSSQSVQKLLLGAALLIGVVISPSARAVSASYFPTQEAASAACLADASAVDPNLFWQYCTGYAPGDVRRWSWHGFINGSDPVWDYVYPLEPCPPGKTFKAPGTCQYPDKPNGCGGIGNPCNAATGNKYQSEEDYRSGDGGLVFARHYNSSRAPVDIGYGFGWMAVVQKRLEIISSAMIAIREQNGRAEYFTNGGGGWQGEADTKLLLTEDGSGFTLKRRDRSSERYDATGKLVSETNTAGKTTTYGYDGGGRLSSITDPFGHTLTFAYNGDNRVESMTDPASSVYTYGYDVNGNLTSVTYPDNTSKIYHYENTAYPHHLTGISFNNGAGTIARFATYIYSSGIWDTGGKAISTEHATTDNGVPQEKFTLNYSAEPGQIVTTVTDATGNKEVFTYSFNLGMPVLTGRLNQGDNKSLTQTYDVRNNLTCRQDEEGRITTYSYNDTNQRIGMTEGLTGTCASPQPTTQTRATTYQYATTTSSLLTLITSPSVASGQTRARSLQYTDSANPNLPTLITEAGFKPDGTPISRVTAFGYNGNGQVTSIDGPRTDVSDVTTFTYYNCTSGSQCGQLATLTNAIGHVTTFDTYDANGRLKQSTDANGVMTSYDYDQRGRLTRVVVTPSVGEARTTQYTYDLLSGNLSTHTAADGRILTYTYDAAHYVRTVTDNLGNKITYGYDIKGNRTSEKTYDPDNTLVRSVNLAHNVRNYVSAVNTAGSLTQFQRDSFGSIVQETDPNNANASTPVRTTNQYDALNRLSRTTDRLEGQTDYGFNVHDNLNKITSPNGLATQYIFDDLGNLLQEQSPQRGVRSYTYDAAGNTLSVADARGLTLTYFYDSLNRITGVDAPGTTEDIGYTYDTCQNGKGKLCQVTDASGTTQFSYDPFGNVITQTKSELGVTYTTRYAYDAADRILSITYPDGLILTYVRDTVGRVTAITQTVGSTTTDVLNGIQYRADGLIKSKTFGNGLTESRSHNTKSQLNSLSFGSVSQTFSYDLNGNLINNSSSTFGYDLLDRIDQATWTGGNNIYTYDGNGDLLLAGVNTTQGPASETYTYTSDGHLATYRRDGALTGSYLYNYQRLRTRKVVSSTTIYHYDLAGNLIQETTASGTPIRTYIWLGDIPVAQIAAAGNTITYLHTDHLNTPRWGTNGVGTLVWKWDGEPFGLTAPNEDPDADGSPTIVNLRFPGQYFDAESGLLYNWNRYYDPKIGRYITSDPIGLAGGLNTYAYVDGNPLRFIDPFGLTSVFRGPRNEFSDRRPPGDQCEKAVWLGGYIIRWEPCDPCFSPSGGSSGQPGNPNSGNNSGSPGNAGGGPQGGQGGAGGGSYGGDGWGDGPNYGWRKDHWDAWFARNGINNMPTPRPFGECMYDLFLKEVFIHGGTETAEKFTHGAGLPRVAKGIGVAGTVYSVYSTAKGTGRCWGEALVRGLR